MNKMPLDSSLASLSDAKGGAVRSLAGLSVLNGCFLRCSDTPEGLLVCDLPRRGGDLSGAEAALSRLGWRLPAWKNGRGCGCMDRAERGLAGQWPVQLDPAALPAFPAREEDFAAYALCRLLLLHPAPLARLQRMELNRALWLWTVRPGEASKPFTRPAPPFCGRGNRCPRWAASCAPADLQNPKGA